MIRLIVLIFVTIVYASVGIYGFCEKVRRKNGNANIVSAPNAGFWPDVLIGGVFLLFAWNTQSSAGVICFCAASLMGSFLLLNWSNNTFTFDEAGFTERNFIGKKKKYGYDQISGTRTDERMPGLVFLYVAERKIGLNLMWENAEAFYDAITAGYEKKHDEQRIPEKSELQEAEKGFRAHVYRADEYRTYFIVIVAVVVCVGMMFILGASRPINTENADQFTLALYSWETQGDQLILHDWQIEHDFIIRGYSECVDELDAMTESLDAQDPLFVLTEFREPAGEEGFYRIYELSTEHETYLTAKDANRYDQKYLPLIIGGFALVLAAVSGVFGLIYAVGSNPEKYPKWLVYRLFKKDRIKM